MCSHLISAFQMLYWQFDGWLCHSLICFVLCSYCVSQKPMFSVCDQQCSCLRWRWISLESIHKTLQRFAFIQDPQIHIEIHKMYNSEHTTHTNGQMHKSAAAKGSVDTNTQVSLAVHVTFENFVTSRFTTRIMCSWLMKSWDVWAIWDFLLQEVTYI